MSYTEIQIIIWPKPNFSRKLSRKFYLRRCGHDRSRICSDIPNRSHRRIGIRVCVMRACWIATSMKLCQCTCRNQFWLNQIFRWRSFRTSLRGHSFHDLDISCTLGSGGGVGHFLIHFQFGHDRAYRLYRLFMVFNLPRNPTLQSQPNFKLIFSRFQSNLADFQPKIWPYTKSSR